MTVRKRPSHFAAGDRFPDGRVVLGLTFVKGGVRVDVRNPDGSLGTVTLSGRFKFDVIPKEAQ